MAAQSQLPLEGGRKPRFANYEPGPNAAVVAALRDWLADPGADLCLLQGPPGCGKTHLLQAAGAQWAGGGRPWRLQPALLGSLPAVDTLGGGLLCVDDVPDLPPTAALELARAIDAAREGRWRLLLASATPVDALDLPFEDLRSRLQWGTRLNLKPLDEAALRRLLAQRARELGVRWTERSSEYLLRRLPREPGVLLHCLELAYRAAVSQRRQLAPPLLAQVLGSPEFAAAVEQAGAEP